MLICLDMRTGTGCGTQNRDNANNCIHCGRPLRYAMPLQNPGAVVGNYRIVRLIGHGGFGAVYEAQDVRTSATVALKETFDADSIRSFRREFDILRGVQHPNLPRYFEMFEQGGNGYLAMEFVPGQNLEEVRVKRGGPLLESQALGFGLQACDALMYLHGQTPPILHRDVKPANIRLTPEGEIKLVDFGLLKEETQGTASSQRAVTPGYAPIEQYGMGGQHTSVRSDIYALGATLYELLTGRVPPPATDRVGAPSDPLTPIERLNPALSPHVAQAVTTALQPFQAERYADVTAFKRALGGASVPAAQAARPQPAPTTPAYVSQPAAQPRMRPQPPPPQAVKPSPPPSKPASASPWIWVMGLGALVVIGLFFILPNLAPRATSPTAAPPTAAPAQPTAAPPTAAPAQPTAAPPTAAPAQPTAAPPTATPAQPTAAPSTAFGAVEERGNDNAPMVFVPAGEFTMGSTDQQAEDAVQGLLKDCSNCTKSDVENYLNTEKPQHTLYLDAFWLDQHEVTNAQYKQCADAGNCQRPGETNSLSRASYYGDAQYNNFPVIYVSWNDARDYCAWAGKRLPSEAEWEKAARGTDSRIYPWGNNFDAAKLNSNEGGKGDTTAVGNYPNGASPYGALDMAGNVWEWVADWYDGGYYKNSPSENPKGPSSGDTRVLRGGAFNYISYLARAAVRSNYFHPTTRFNYIGFRCAQ